MVLGTLDSLIGVDKSNNDFLQSTIDPLVGYDGTSLMNMPKSTFEEMIDELQTHSAITTVNAVNTKSNYQKLINDAGNSAAPSQVFWNFLTDSNSPVNLSPDQLDAISLALTQANPNDDAQGHFCGTLNSLNQILRNGILTDQVWIINENFYISNRLSKKYKKRYMNQIIRKRMESLEKYRNILLLLKMLRP